MDPNLVRNRSDFYNSDLNYWDLNGFNFTNSEPLYQFDAAAADPSDDANIAVFNSLPDPSLEDSEFSETARYISQILMEENFEEKPCMYYDPLSLQITEKSFSDALIAKLPHSPDQHPHDSHQNLESPDENCSRSTSTANSGSSGTNIGHESKHPSPDTPVSDGYTFRLNSDSTSQLPQHALTNISNGMLDLDSSVTKLLAQNIFSGADSILQFKRGLEEASKFLPQRPQIFTGLESSMGSINPKGEGEKVANKIENGVRENWNGLKNRKNHERESEGLEDEEGRSNKQSAVSCVAISSFEESELSEMLDQVLLSIENVPLISEQQHGSVIDSNRQPNEKPHSSNEGKTRSKKQSRKKETVDLRTLLILCAQAVSTGDNRTANELLKQIRQHSSHLGDASQRLAHYFANGLEARLIGAGTGTQIFVNSSSYKNFTAADFIKAYQLTISVCPFKKVSHFFANKMIMKAAENAETLHIIDFGILYGFQWPILIKFLSERSGGPPKLRITGIEYPQPGFRPSERLEETGHRLANYCKRFNVPFEFKAITSRNWETIQIGDLKIRSNEVLAVNCLIRFRNLLDETIEVNSPRNAVLDLIRKMSPDIFVQSIINGSYNSPFFATRFREALFHFSAVYDMYDNVISRKNEWRLMIEREIPGREIMNVVACEGFERVERPETYKQWQVRNTRAGFKQIPLDKELMTKFKGKIRKWYQHDKDFVFDEDNNWMLQGWKGRILYASTAWVTA
ncbi:PREDICTED: scarecrow-like protein 14 [Lupinus angustifolius]|nr:PREDICTED: scarecrow-like protein 14 [Lupinus angustifolius]